MKLIAFYLPQFHAVPENDEWWGKGFTEWVNVKKAKPIFKNQTQPKIPLNNNYYDLMDRKTVEWQTDLMRKYGIYGFCYFHYWFTGRLLLNKPAENLLEWTDISQPFCFAWANATWARTWTTQKGMSTNWVPQDGNAKGNGVLLEQQYGDESDWTQHYTYLRKFFQDERYIKVEGCPVFLIYRINDIECAKEMFELWERLAIADGFPGIHLVSINDIPDNSVSVNAIARYGRYGVYDPHKMRDFYNRIVLKLKLSSLKLANIYDYETVWRNMVSEKPYSGYQTYLGAVVTYDETPRKGENATFLSGATPELFECYLKKQIKRAKEECNTEFIFIDAWNEWGEGNYLEPDEENGYGYLEAVKKALDENA